MAYRKGGRLSAHERWYIGDNELETVKEYKYLGKLFSTKLSTNTALADLACRAKGAIAQVNS